MDWDETLERTPMKDRAATKVYVLRDEAEAEIDRQAQVIEGARRELEVSRAARHAIEAAVFAFARDRDDALDPFSTPQWEALRDMALAAGEKETS